MMKIAVIGAGNMGGAVARGLASKGKYGICVSNPSAPKLLALKEDWPEIEITSDNVAAIVGADIIVLAVKPWKVQEVLEEIKPGIDPDSQRLVSLAAGVTVESLSLWLGNGMPVFYAIPNTAVRICRSMTFIVPGNASEADILTVQAMFDDLGSCLVIEQKQMNACMALASCGIAYAMRYVRANVEGGVELGLKPSDATTIVAQTLIGAAELLLSGSSHPEAEIDKVTTPGGLTIKGLNTLEAHGFTTAVIEALKASLPR